MAIAATKSRAQRPRVGIVLLYTALSAGALLMATPLLMMLLTSLKTPAEALRMPPVIIPAQPTLDAYRTVLTQAPFLTWFRNSVIVAISVTALILFSSSLGGYIFAKFSFPGKNVLFTLLLATLMVPFPVILI